MKNKILLIIICSLFVNLGFSQEKWVKGYVKDTDNNTLVGANIYWDETWSGVSSNEKGYFELKQDTDEVTLIISFVGYLSKKIKNPKSEMEIILEADSQLEGVEVTARKQGSFISSLNPIKTETISSAELTKSSCCDLAGCFETEASVQPTVTNVVTNAKELRILGLSGVYNQILIDGLPIIQGLSYTYGINSIPGVMVDKIHVSKGANSILQGSESMAGSINVMTLEPNTADQLMVNAFMNSNLEKQVNLSYAGEYRDYSNVIMLHTTQQGIRADHDEDTFMDMPLLTRYSIADKIKLRHEDSLGLSSLVFVRYLYENRIGGQMDFQQEKEGDTQYYGQTVTISQPMYYSKTNYRFDYKNKLSLNTFSTYHKQDSWFGVTNHDAFQLTAYANLEYELQYKTHFLKIGSTYKQSALDEKITFLNNDLNRTYAGNYTNNELLLGGYAENSFFLQDKKWVIITGMRADHHNQFGWMYTPRALAKYSATDKTDIRLSIGQGWRTSNVFAENVNLLASSRDILFTEDLKPEQSVNFGGNITHKINATNLDLTLSMDVYRTQFQNQIFTDYYTSPTKAYISNFDGESVANGVQIESNWTLYRMIEAKLAYNYLDVYRMIDGEKRDVEFNAKHKVSGAISYIPENSNWQYDVNAHWYGKQTLPNTESNPELYRRESKSEPYTLVNAQIRYNYANFSFYGGCENILAYRQEQPIIGWQDPFGAYFDTSSAWGPTKGREFYLGLTYKL